MTPPDGNGEASARPAGGLSRAAVGSVMWQGLSFLLGRGLNFAATVVLARLLTPHDFGVVGLAIIFVTFAEYISDLGLANAIVYFAPDQGQRDLALVLTTVWGAVLCLAGVLAAPAIAGLFGTDAIVPMIRVLSLTLLISAVRQVPDAVLRRELDFRRRVVVQAVQSTIQGLASVGIAIAGGGAWSIVAGYVAGVVAACATTWSLAPYRPRLRSVRLDRVETRRLLAYGTPAAAQALLAGLIVDVDYLIVGAQLGSVALGTYTLAFRLPQVLIIAAFGVLSAVAFPMYSRARTDPAQLRRGYLTSIRLQMAYGAAVGTGLFMLAPLLVPVVYGARWHASVAVLEPLALYGVARSLGAGAVEVYKGVGRPGIGARVAAVRLAILVPALLVAVRGGIVAVAWAQAVLALVFAVGMQVVAMRVVALRPGDYLATVRPAIALAVGTVAGTGAFRLVFSGAGAPELVAAALAGAAAGLAALALVDASFLREMRGLLGRPSRSPAVAA